jgi:peptide/nickel transport system substrate-binding protein
MKKIIKKSGRLVKKITKRSLKAKNASKAHIKENLFARISNIRQIRLWIVEWILLVLAIILFSVVQSIWYRNAYNVTAFVAGGTYSEATFGKVNSMNPLYATTSSEKTLSRLLFSSLFAVDASGHINTDLARDIKTEDSGKTWIVTLKDTVKWSDGQPVTPDDVIYTFEVIQNARSKTNYSANFNNVTLEKTDQNALKFNLPSPFANFPSTLTFPIIPAHILKDITPELLFEHNFSTNPIGSGPFTLNTAQSIGDKGEKIIFLARNTLYHKGTTMLDRFTIHAYPDRSSVLAAINSLTATATAELSPTDKPNITSSDIYEKQTAINSGIFVFLNCDSPTLSDTKVRSAIQSGLDISDLRSVFGDEQALDFPLIPSSLGIDNPPKLPTHDVAPAQEYTKSASTPPHLSIATTSTGYFPKLAEKLSDQLRNLGFDTELNIYDITDYGSDFFTDILRPRNYDILIYEVELGLDLDPFAYYHSSQATESGFNLSNYKNALSDDLLLSARQTLDTKLRAAKYTSFLRRWLDDVPAIGIVQTNLSYYFNKNTRAFSEDNRLITPLDRFSDVIYWSSEKSLRNRTP